MSSSIIHMPPPNPRIILPYILYLLSLLLVALPCVHSACDLGLFGANCTDICHCLNGPSGCDPDTGACDDFMCEKGWKGSPICQIPCEANKEFGVNCQHQCHCPVNETCSPINGLCSSGRCHEEWTGPGCQTRLPKLVTAPIILNVTCSTLNVTWPAWRESFDVGSPPIHGYSIEVSINNSAWRWISTVPHDASAVTYNVYVEGLLRYAIYQYRVITNRDTFGIAQPGFPGPLSEKVSPFCIDPTTTTTSTTTTTTTTPSTVASTTQPSTSESTATTTVTEPVTTAATTPAPKVPSYPSDVRVGRSDSELYVTWKPPLNPNGVIMQYEVVYQVTGQSTRSTILQDAGLGNNMTISGLNPHTTYRVEVKARNAAGWSDASTTVEVTTYEGKPSPPTQLRMTARDEACLTLNWQPPLTPNGVVTKYLLEFKQETTYSGDPLSPSAASVNGDILTYQKCRLLAGILYKVTIVARNGYQDSEGATVSVYTEVSKPPKPVAPSFLNATLTTVTVLLRSVTHPSGPLSAYYVIVNRVGATRKRRATEEELIMSQTDVPGYIAAKLLTQEVNPTLTFSIGDDKKYGKYRNTQLEKSSNYSLAFVVESRLDGVSKFTASDAQFAATAGPTTIPPSGGANLPLIIGLCIGILVLILLIILIAFLIWRHTNRRDSLDLKPTWLEYYKAHFTQEVPVRTSGWSDIYSLNESRYVKIVDPDADKDDVQVSVTDGKQSPITFEQEFLQLPHGQKYPWKIAQRSENNDKNRFDHILAYDHSRVVLKKTPVSVSNYTNANYINGYKSQKAYIAAQSPFNDLTINDFWQLIFQENVMQIIFIANPVEDGILKCEPYWPDVGYQYYRSIHVQLLGQLEYANFTVRFFQVTDETENVARRVTQYHFTSWPEHGVPEDPIPFLEFRNKVSRDIQEGQGPMLVHCGTGVSRTSVFIAVDSLLQEAQTEGLVNVFKFAKRMRRNRTFMIRTLKQYLFIYDTLFESLQTNHNVVGENNLKANYRLLANINPVSQKSYFREQFEVMERLTPELNREKCMSGTLDINTQKNRFSTLIPPDNHRPRIRSVDIQSDYVNAVFLDSYTQANAFVLTQTPLPSTVTDFWSLVYDHNVHTIVMMNDDSFREDTCAIYWPSQATRNGTVKYHPFLVELLSVETKPHFVAREMTLQNAAYPDETPRRVKQFQLRGWRMYDKLPPSRHALLELIESVEAWREGGVEAVRTPVLVHCMDGATRSGLFASYA